MLNKLFISCIVMLVFSSCNSEEVKKEQENEIKVPVVVTDLDWIPGVWIDSTSFKMIGQTFVESWRSEEKDVFKGVKYAIKNGVNGDSTNLSIEKTNGLFYLTVNEGGKESTFMQQPSEEGNVKFSNTKDEFPYDITYLLNDNNLQITVSGSQNGVNRTILYNTLRK